MTTTVCALHGQAFTNACPGCAEAVMLAEEGMAAGYEALLLVEAEMRAEAPRAQCRCGQGIDPWRWCHDHHCPIMDALDMIDELWQRPER